MGRRRIDGSGRGRTEGQGSARSRRGVEQARQTDLDLGEGFLELGDLVLDGLGRRLGVRVLGGVLSSVRKVEGSADGDVSFALRGWPTLDCSWRARGEGKEGRRSN